MTKRYTLTVKLRRRSTSVPWGISIAGGTDLGTPLVVTRVSLTPISLSRVGTLFFVSTHRSFWIRELLDRFSATFQQKALTVLFVPRAEKSLFTPNELRRKKVFFFHGVKNYVATCADELNTPLWDRASRPFRPWCKMYHEFEFLP